MPVVYAELHRLAHRHLRGWSPGHGLQTTALVHEAYLRLLGSRQVGWQNRAHFFALAARLMRRVLVDAVRAVDLQAGDAVRAVADMLAAGAALATTDRFIARGCPRAGCVLRPATRALRDDGRAGPLPTRRLRSSPRNPRATG